MLRYGPGRPQEAALHLQGWRAAWDEVSRTRLTTCVLQRVPRAAVRIVEMSLWGTRMGGGGGWRLLCDECEDPITLCAHACPLLQDSRGAGAGPLRHFSPSLLGSLSTELALKWGEASTRVPGSLLQPCNCQTLPKCSRQSPLTRQLTACRQGAGAVGGSWGRLCPQGLWALWGRRRPGRLAVVWGWREREASRMRHSSGFWTCRGAGSEGEGAGSKGTGGERTRWLGPVGCREQGQAVTLHSVLRVTEWGRGVQSGGL